MRYRVTLGLAFVLATAPLQGGCAQKSPQPKADNSTGAAPQARGRGEQELIMAAWQGDVKKMGALLDAGADANASEPTLGSPLAAAAYSGSYDAVRLLLDKGANVNAEDDKGNTALMNASVKDNADVVRLLLEKGADANAERTAYVDGRPVKATALRLARGRGHADIVNLLVRAGAKE